MSAGPLAIYILEDQHLQAKIIEEIIKEQCNESNHGLEPIFTFSSGAPMLTKVRTTMELNIFFIDLQLGDKLEAGLEVASELRKFDESSLIVFVTTHSELALTAYKYYVAALTFIEKNTDVQSFTDETNRCLSIYFAAKNPKAATDIFTYQTKTSIIQIPFEDIYCFSTIHDHRILLEAKGQTREFFGTLKEIEGSDPRLLRVHQAYLINSAKIQELHKTKKELLLSNMLEIPISRKYYKKVLDVIANRVS